LKIAGFHHMSLPTTAAISRRVASPRVCNSLHEVAKICTLSRGTQNSIVTVSNPKPRKNTKVVEVTSFRFVSNPKVLISQVGELGVKFPRSEFAARTFWAFVRAAASILFSAHIRNYDADVVDP
jgi:hypothetical protein